MILKLYNIKVVLVAKCIALKRRIVLLFNKEFNPYPKIPHGMSFSPSEFQAEQIKNLFPKLNLKEINLENYKKLQSTTRKKIEDLTGLNKNLNFKILKTNKYVFKEKYIRKRIYVSLGKSRELPIDLLYKNTLNKAKGIMICMQGTNSGAHLSFGEIRMPADPFKVNAGSSLALQAADNNYIALSFDRIGYGERKERKLLKPSELTEIDASLHSIALGSSLLGETLSEVYTISKWLKSEYNNLPVWCLGYSTAGNIALIAGSLFKNEIDGVCIGGCIGFFKDTILKRGVTAHLEVMDCCEWFEQDVFIKLMAPRPCIVIAGVKDHIWPYKGAKNVINAARPIFRKLNVSNNINLIKGEHNHTYYPNLMWPAIDKFF